MPAGNQIHRLNGRPELFRGDGTDPALARLVRVGGDGLTALGVDFELQLDDIAQALDAAAEDGLAVGLGADPAPAAFAFVAGEEELQDSVFVVEVSDAVGDDRAGERVVGERAGRPEMRLELALGLVELRGAGLARGFSDELAAGGDAGCV